MNVNKVDLLISRVESLRTLFLIKLSVEVFMMVMLLLTIYFVSV